ncbi:MAG: PD-(D/E)XK nuclease family protein [Candidatus Omnitrophica bacterium]|nr:PD-(D/E)XK nuclease family protein [Candidatus Omnitrophota bacterium]
MGKKRFLSPATINLYRECPRCFYLHMKYGIKRPRGPMPSIATGLDSVLKKYFNYYRSIKELPPELKNEMRGHLIEKLRPTYYRDIREGYCLLGKLDDCLVTEKGTYIPLDFKTRASKVEENIHPSYPLQMEFYCILLEGNGMETEDVAYLLYYYPLSVNPDEEVKETRSIIFSIDIKKIDIDKKYANTILEQAIDCLEQGKLPEASKECEYCKWIESVCGTNSLVGIPVKKDEKPPEPEEIIKEEEYRDTLF